MQDRESRFKEFWKHFQVYHVQKRAFDKTTAKATIMDIAGQYMDALEGRVTPASYRDFLQWLANSYRFLVDVSELPEKLTDWEKTHRPTVSVGLTEPFRKFLIDFSCAADMVDDERISNYCMNVYAVGTVKRQYVGLTPDAAKEFLFKTLQVSFGVSEASLNIVRNRLEQLKRKPNDKENQDLFRVVNTITKKMEA